MTVFIFDDKKFIGMKIKQLRSAAGMSQDELSEKIGMTEKNLSNIERGLQFPALNSFLKLLQVLNIQLNEFGIEVNQVKNLNRDKLIKEIYLANEDELETYLNIIESIKKLKVSKRFY